MCVFELEPKRKEKDQCILPHIQKIVNLSAMQANNLKCSIVLLPFNRHVGLWAGLCVCVCASFVFIYLFIFLLLLILHSAAALFFAPIFSDGGGVGRMEREYGTSRSPTSHLTPYPLCVRNNNEKQTQNRK